jgi:hypothetical protein
MQRVNGARCQSISRAMRKARAVSSMTSPGTSTTGAVPATSVARCRSLGQQDPILFGAARGECAVGKPACRNDSVVTGRTQPSAQVAQHLVAQEPPHLPGPEASEPAAGNRGAGGKG